MRALSPEGEPVVSNGDLGIGGFDQRRIRHISSIQVRNLTPFPVRDAFASALAQPSEQPQFTVHGHLSDDLDVTLSRKRSRRISVNSVNTLRSLRSEEGGTEEARGNAAGEPRGRKSSGSRVGFSGTASLGRSSGAVSAGRSLPASAAPTIRPGNRNRTSSIASAITSPFAGTSFPVSAFSMTSTLPDNSQAGLEKVIKARLVETFLTIAIPPGECSTWSRTSTPPYSAPPTKEVFSVLHRKTAPSNGISHASPRPLPLKPAPKSIKSPRRESPVSPRPAASISILSHQKSSSNSSLRPNGKLSASTTSASQKIPRRASSPPYGRDSPSAPLHPPPAKIPNYISPIHRPSTNPSFPLDPRSGHEFAEWSELSGDKLKVEVWGRVGLFWPGDGGAVSGKGKEKERIDGDGTETGVEWKVLEEWNISLADLIPLPKDLASNLSHLPSNTLLVTLSPPGQTFYLPSPRSFTRTPSPSPSTGYNSDPESEVRKVKQAGDVEPGSNVEISARSRRRHRRSGDVAVGLGREESVKTAGLQDFLKLVDLQSCIIDNSRSLSDIILEIDRVLEGDVASVLKREVSERESRLEGLGEDLNAVRNRSDKLRSQLESRREQLRQRKEMLGLAKSQHESEIALEVEREAEVEDARVRVSTLRSRFTPTRTTLLTTLSAMFPIDLLSPPDLLYTILDVPLPIPVSSSDPGPPLTLAAHKEVTEDSVATALGYAAQVVQLLAAYLGKGLIYPVTCIGSRSLIRDGISALVGPRMFPLFSRGVDTYRFEYGVFLLNKDIEMLMADRDLRALDMRHTLPNLKNLLLTLTDGEGAQLAAPRVNSPLSSAGLESPPRAESPRAERASEVTGNNSRLDSPVENNTPPESGSTTPTAVTDTSRKSRAFLGLYPLAGFLRSHYPTSRPLGKSETSQGSHDLSDAAADSRASDDDDDEDSEGDRRTLRGVSMDGIVCEPEAKAMNGYGVEHGQPEEEKLADIDTVASPEPSHVTT